MIQDRSNRVNFGEDQKEPGKILPFKRNGDFWLKQKLVNEQLSPRVLLH